MLDVARLMDTRSLSFDGGLQELATLFHRIALAQFAPEALLDDAERSRLMPYAQALDAEYLQLAYQIAIHGRDELSLAPDDYAGFVMTLLRLHAFGPERSAAAGPVAKPAAPLRQATPAAASAAASVAPPAAIKAVAAVPPAPTSASVAERADQDWHALAGRFPGMARQLAQHCELVERDATRVRLRLAPAHKHLQAHQEKLQQALRELWGAHQRLEIAVAEPGGETPAARRQNTERERQEKAVASIEQDPFVRDVVDLFDASIDESTIKPV